jgi:hypothetical protein
MLKTTEVLVPACRSLVGLQVLQAYEIDFHALDNDRFTGRVALAELDAGYGCEDLNPDGREPHADNPVLRKEQILREFGKVEADSRKTLSSFLAFSSVVAIRMSRSAVARGYPW